MYRVTTKLYDLNKPDKNGRVYKEGCFDKVDEEDWYPVVFQNDDLSLPNILCKANMIYDSNMVEIATEPLLNNHRFPRFKEIMEAFDRGELKLAPCGHGLVEYDAENNVHIITDYHLTHFEICPHVCHPWTTTLEAL